MKNLALFGKAISQNMSASIPFKGLNESIDPIVADTQHAPAQPSII
jgi:hypothetical protein